ncbi:MAG: hypothetical protein C4541_03655 [Candidatus Auribacter fodinae]|jgi:hypothetical protein|uniref:Uncharacterized protein n=1 Tax=Candidatus Auribacter fodinae TaxID=2093366 RepID=A0A3A4R7H3_9BACT|nr:MAG: hypothetical protein C4541_03655 [Candidatus Auribacter fodinae]
MGYIEWANKKIRNFSAWDIAILKTGVMAFTLTVAKLWPKILSLPWYAYGIVFAVCWVYLLTKMFK